MATLGKYAEDLQIILETDFSMLHFLVYFSPVSSTGPMVESIRKRKGRGRKVARCGPANRQTTILCSYSW